MYSPQIQFYQSLSYFTLFPYAYILCCHQLYMCVVYWSSLAQQHMFLTGQPKLIMLDHGWFHRDLHWPTSHYYYNSSDNTVNFRRHSWHSQQISHLIPVCPYLHLRDCTWSPCYGSILWKYGIHYWGAPCNKGITLFWTKSNLCI